MLERLYLEHFINFWIPKLKRDIFKYRIKKDKAALANIKIWIWDNTHFTKEQKYQFYKELDLLKI